MSLLRLISLRFSFHPALIHIGVEDTEISLQFTTHRTAEAIASLSSGFGL